MVDLENELKKAITTLELTSTSALFEITLPADFTYFRGHFPGRPVLPAVAFINITDFLIQKNFLSNSKFTLSKINYFKAKKILSPNELVVVKLTQLSEGEFELNWGDCALIKLSYQ